MEHTTARFVKSPCVIRVLSRNAVVEALHRDGIVVGVHYKPNHQYPLFSEARREDLSVTEQAYDQIMSLPLHLLLTDEKVREVCQSLRAALKSSS